MWWSKNKNNNRSDENLHDEAALALAESRRVSHEPSSNIVNQYELNHEEDNSMTIEDYNNYSIPNDHDQLPSLEEYKLTQQVQQQEDQEQINLTANSDNRSPTRPSSSGTYLDDYKYNSPSTGSNRIEEWSNRQLAREEELSKKYQDKYAVDLIYTDVVPDAAMTTDDDDHDNDIEVPNQNTIRNDAGPQIDFDNTTSNNKTTNGLEKSSLCTSNDIYIDPNSTETATGGIRSQVEDLIDFARNCRLFHDDDSEEEEEETIVFKPSPRALSARERLRQLENDFGGNSTRSFGNSSRDGTDAVEIVSLTTVPLDQKNRNDYDYQSQMKQRERKRRKGYALFGSRKNKGYVVGAFFLIMVSFFLITVSILRTPNKNNTNQSFAAAKAADTNGNGIAKKNFNPGENYLLLTQILVHDTEGFDYSYQQMYWNPVVISSFNTPQANALVWLANDDDITKNILGSLNDPIVDISTVQRREILQRYIMVLFYFSTSKQYNNGGWTNRLGFLSTDASVCDWNVEEDKKNDQDDNSDDNNDDYNIRCNSDNSIIEFTLGENNLVGELPSELAKLSDLQALAIYQNPGLKGSIPIELSELTRLQFLGLANNQLEGNLPGELFENLSNLEYLLLRENKFTGPIPIELGTSTQIEAMDLAHNSFDGPLPFELFYLWDSLYHLDVSYNLLNGEIPSNHLKKLEILSNLQIQSNPDLFGSIEFMCDDMFNNETMVVKADSCGTEPNVECSCCYCPPPN